MELDLDQALRYLGAGECAPDQLRRQTRQTAQWLTAQLQPRYLYRLFPLGREGDAIRLEGATLDLTGRTARTMLAECDQAVLLCCTLGPMFDALLRREQARDMAQAAILDACGSALAEAGCDQAQAELQSRFPGRFLTDRFSPGYGDLPLSLQPQICAVLDAQRRLGVTVSDTFLLNPVKTVTAILGLSDRPQRARVRGCAYCSMKETCVPRKGGTHCGI